MSISKKSFIVAAIIFAISFSAMSESINVSDEAQLLAAVSNPSIDTINITANINFSSVLADKGIGIPRNLTINGQSPTNKTTINADGISIIFVMSGNNSLTINNLILTEGLSSNFGTPAGGAVHISGGTFTANNCEFYNNTVINGESGGAVYISGGTFIANNCEFYNNSAYSGSAVYISGGTFIANNCEFYNNSANTNGAVYVYEGIFTADNCEFYSNTSKYIGGAVYIMRNTTFTANNCKFTNNRVDCAGGAVLMDGSKFTAINCEFINNILDPGCGGNDGSAVSFVNSSFTAINCVFLDNISGDGIDAAAVRVAGDFIALNCVFSGNTGYGEGGGIYIANSSSAYLYHCTIDKNEPTGEGGGIYITPSGKLYVYNTIITGNTAGGVLNQIAGGGTKTLGNNLIEGENDVTRDLVFGNNQLTSENYIKPLEYAQTATRLTSSDIEAPEEIITAEEIIELLITDQIGQYRPNNPVTYGSLEIEPIPTFTLQLKTLPLSIGELKGDGKYQYDESVTITATTNNDCYNFLHWEDDSGNVISTQAEYTFNITSDLTLTAVFLLKEFAVTIYTYPTYMGDITGATTGTYYCDTVLNLQATPTNSEVYAFKNWTDDNNNIISTDSNISVLITNDTTLIANFINIIGITEDDIYDISIVPNPVENYFNIIFNNPDEQRISIHLLDISGTTILDIFEGFASQGEQNYNIDKKLSSGTYFIKIVANGNAVFRKVIVK
ncbi:MAG: T9SS type A sorting domain-containing protein [Bacteroidetes bacterium]|nr:T9SS type A sorting domain-containing protein [Bacteroidota bacterium]